MTFTFSVVGTARAQEAGSDTQTGTGAQTPALSGAETHTETGVAHETTVFPPFDPTHFSSQLLWLAITFGLFYWFMSRVVVPRISGILEGRRDRISGDGVPSPAS